MRSPNKYRLWWVWVAVGVVATAAPAPAFYWKGWPGSRLAPEPTLLVPADENPGRPPGPAAEPIPIPGGHPSQPTPGGPPPPPEHVPEPGTGLVGLIGLGALAARRWWKKWE